MSPAEYSNPYIRNFVEVTLRPIYWSAYLFHRLFGLRSERKGRTWEVRLNYAYFFQGVPMLLGLTGIVVVAALAWRETFRREEAYADAARAAFDLENYSTASLYYERLSTLKPDVVHYRYNLGLCCAHLGDDPRAAALLVPLAPEDELGYPPAHYWVAARILSQPQPSAAELQLAERHFLRLRRNNVGFAEAAEAGLAEVFARQGRVDEILNDSKLYDAAAKRPELRLLFAQAAARQGRAAEAAEEARKLVPELRKRSEEFPDDESARRRLIDALGLSGDDVALLAALRQGASLRPNGPFGLQLAEYLTARAVRMSAGGLSTKAEKTRARLDAVQHLDRHGGDSDRAQLLAGQLMRLDGNFPEAERRYRALAERWPPARIELADLYVELKRPDEARREWTEFLRIYDARLAAKANVSNDERLMAAVAARRLDRFADAERWLAEAEPSPQMTAARLQFYVSWWDELLRRDPALVDVEVLRKGLRLDPGYAPVLSRLLTAARRPGEPGRAAQAMLQEMIVRSDLPAVAYLLLGTDAYERGDSAAAREYLEHALRLDAKSPVILNNLAWTLLTAEPPDPQSALAPADAAVTLDPGNPHYRDTRLRILAKLGQWKRALEDLEACAAAMSGKPDFHLLAAEVYDQLKLPELASAHRRAAEKDMPPPPSP